MGSVAVYPGSFDPITVGHLDIMRRGAALFDQLVVAIARNPAKEPLFSEQDRLEMIKDLLADLPNVRVDQFEGLIVDFANQVGANAILRGLRTFSDFEYEFQMALTNRTVAPKVETVFVMTNVAYSFISSRLIKEVASMGGDVSTFVPAPVLPKLHAAIARRRAGGAKDGGWGEPEEGASARPDDEGMR